MHTDHCVASLAGLVLNSSHNTSLPYCNVSPCSCPPPSPCLPPGNYFTYQLMLATTDLRLHSTFDPRGNMTASDVQHKQYMEMMVRHTLGGLRGRKAGAWGGPGGVLEVELVQQNRTGAVEWF